MEQQNARVDPFRRQLEIETETDTHYDNLPPIRANRPYVAPGLRRPHQ